MTDFKKSQYGQGLLEVVFAITILVMALSAILALTTSNIVGQKESEFQIVANNLAREGIEVVRSIRDSNWLAGDNWDLDLTATGGNLTTAEFDSALNLWTLNFNYTDDTLYVSGGIYTHDNGGKRSEFKRFLILDDICQLPTGSESITDGTPCVTGQKVGVKVTSEVNWLDRGKERQVILESFLYAWK